ncbi:uncharacterized protein MONBRDRAFT_37855 [Monosiga brevicollis MX1]|uniref:Transmembrane 9 superfamily member n=1 Tax=Monosiga brevicollis TaxID=81824 RepID=A9V495_MONBE|nr:uncharacterized protein MONBRDRAFT_37855 [Monosiga brevicollis MX1]EDQ87579.1 predicted protein [Monosiga brevicollis MX1]|eukprot:XP_001747499.1 hypothetical protein [Monosiga brevicollis MX1]
MALFATSRLAAMLLLLATVAHAFYLPGVAPRSFAEGEKIPLQVNRLDSTESVMPFDYYFFDFCEPGETPYGRNGAHEGAKVSENIGQIILGERIRQGPYEIKMLQGESCRALCARTYNASARKDVLSYRRILNAIKKDYMNHWIMDNMPVVECTANCKGGARPQDQPYYRMGFPVGCAIGEAAKSMTICTINNINNMYPKEVFLNNHVDIIVKYHQAPEFEGSRVVGVQIRPRSIKHESIDNLNCDSGAPPQPFHLASHRFKHKLKIHNVLEERSRSVADAAAKKSVDGAVEAEAQDNTPQGEELLHVIYSYGVFFEASDVKWASRWDTYLQSSESTSIHWFSIVNSLIIVVFLSGMLGVIMVRTLHKDINRYNNADDKEEAQEEFGWKLVHGDVFRPPRGAIYLSCLVGNGVQLLAMAIVTLFFASLGFLSPATRGSLMTAMITLWVILGTPAGYASARLYKTMGGEEWKRNVIMTAVALPVFIFTVFFMLNLVMWGEASSAAVPFGTLVALSCLWLFVSVPLTFVGAYMGFKRPPLEQPVRTNPIPRQIPPQNAYTRLFPAMLMGGILPFGCIFIQLFFILNSIWGHKLYYVFGFLFLVFIILVITTVESTILLCYFHLCSENYHWWWRSFLTGGAPAIYLFIYELIFYFRRMEVEGYASLMLYAGYSLIASIIFFVMSGTVGFLGCFAFVRRIYDVIKVD